MYTHHRPIQLARAFARPRFAAGILVTLALLTAACSDSDPASRINAPSLLSSSNSGQSAGNDRHRGDGRDGRDGVSDFAVLAGTAVTCTNSTITGDVGVYPGTAVTHNVNCTINGRIHAGDGVAKKAFEAFLAEYDDVADIVCTDFLDPAYGVGTLTLEPGVYCTTAALTFTGTTLILDANDDPNAVWIFKIGTSGTGALTGTNFSVVMEGGDPCNVIWWTAQAATITDSDEGVPHFFVGTILAGTAIDLTGTVGTIADRLTFTGDAFAKTAVTMKDTNLTGCEGGKRTGRDKDKCNQGVGNGFEGCDPGDSNHRNPSNDERGGEPGTPGRQGGH